MVRLAGGQVKFFLFCFRLSFSGKAVRRVSLSGGQALCSVMSMLAAMSRSRAPGSWAMHSSTRAWLVRKPQLATAETYHNF
jgi:hypothetical protein